MRIYRKNPQGYYVYPIYNYLSVWFGLAVLIAVVSNFLLGVISFQALIDLKSLAIKVSIVLGLIELIKIIVGSFQNKSLFKYFESLVLADNIRQALLNTMTLNLYKDSPFVEAPKIKVTFVGDKIKVYVAKLPGMTDIDKIQANINSSFRGRFKVYAVTTAIEQDDGTAFNFVLENVGEDKTFIPKIAKDLLQKPYMLKLQKNLVLNLSKYPHIAVWGQTGAGKTTVLMNIIAQCLSCNTDLFFIDGKTEFSSFSTFYPSEKIVTDNEDILVMLKHISETIMQRQKLVADEVKKRHLFGLTGYSIGLVPIVIIADEVGSVVSSMDNKQKKQFIAYLTQIIQKGRSVSVFLITASQSPAVTVLPNGIRSQFSTKILLGSASGEVQRMAFDTVATDGGVERFQGYYLTSGLTVQPQKYYVPNLFKYDLENMQTFEGLYNWGKNHFKY